MNIHFKIDDPAVIEAMESKLKDYRRVRGDWRLRNAALAKAIVERAILKEPEFLRELTGLNTEQTSPGSEMVEQNGSVDRRVFKRDIPLKGGPDRRSPRAADKKNRRDEAEKPS